MNAPKISACIITKNEEARIGACLDSLKWVDEIVVVDSMSTDETVRIARKHGARFELLTGRVTALPAVFPVNAYPVRVVNGQVEVDLGVPTKELEVG